MGLEFITRILRTSAIVGLLAACCLAYYFDWKFGLGFLSGLAWGLANIFVIRQLIVAVTGPGEKPKTLMAVLAVIKFPLLYVGGYFLAASGWFSIYSLLIGFSFVFVVIILKAVGRLMLGLDLPLLKQNRAESTR